MTVKQLEKIAWLNRAFYVEKKVKALESLCRRDKERTQQITANYDCKDSGRSDGHKNGVEEALLMLAESNEKYDNALHDYSKLRREIETAIEQLHDYELESIFVYRYLEYRTISEIAEIMNYAEVTIKRKHLKGIKKMIPNDIA